MRDDVGLELLGRARLDGIVAGAAGRAHRPDEIAHPEELRLEAPHRRHEGGGLHLDEILRDGRQRDGAAHRMGEADMWPRQTVLQFLKAIGERAHERLEPVDMSLLAVTEKAVGQTLTRPVEDQDRKAHLLEFAADLEILLDELRTARADNDGAARLAGGEGGRRAGAQLAAPLAPEPDNGRALGRRIALQGHKPRTPCRRVIHGSCPERKSRPKVSPGGLSGQCL